MIDRFLRQLTVRQRIVAGFLLPVLLLVLSLPLLVINQSFLLERLQQVAEVQARADRLLLVASARVESSRVNLMRYIQDYAPSAYEALDDVDQAIQLVTEAQGLATTPEQEGVLGTLLGALDDYQGLIADVAAARSQGETQEMTTSLFQSYRLGSDIGQRIEQTVKDSEASVAAANETIYSQARTRMALLGLVYVVMIALSLVLAGLVQRSITRPVAELRLGAEAFRQGQMDTAVPVEGRDELSLLARAFNELAARLRDLVDTLEQRVAERTRALELRAVQLATAAEVGRAAASILELEALTEQVVRLVQDRFHLYYVGLFLVDGTGRSAVLAAGTGEAGRAMKEEGHRLQIGGVSMVGAACAEGRARLALDVGTAPVRFDNPLLPETRSEIALPLVVGERVLGALDAQSTQPDAFSEEGVAVLQLVADQVAVAVDNARRLSDEAGLLEATSPLYRVSRRLAETVTTEQIVEAIVTSVAETEADGCAVGRLGYGPDGEIESATFLGGWNRQGKSGFPIGVRFAADSSPLPLQMVTNFWTMDDVTEGSEMGGHQLSMLGAGARAFANIPLQVGEQVIGFVSIFRVRPGPFSPVSLRLYETLVDQAAVALERARLLEETQQRAARDRLVDQISGQLQGLIDPDIILQTAVRELGRALGSRQATIKITGVRSGDGDALD